MMCVWRINARDWRDWTFSIHFHRLLGRWTEETRLYRRCSAPVQTNSRSRSRWKLLLRWWWFMRGGYTECCSAHSRLACRLTHWSRLRAKVKRWMILFESQWRGWASFLGSGICSGGHGWLMIHLSKPEPIDWPMLEKDSHPVSCKGLRHWGFRVRIIHFFNSKWRST